MDDAGDIAPAAAMGMMIFYTNAAVRIIYVLITKKILVRFQKWRTKNSLHFKNSDETIKPQHAVQRLYELTKNEKKIY